MEHTSRTGTGALSRLQKPNYNAPLMERRAAELSPFANDRMDSREEFQFSNKFLALNRDL